jgi:hypothetical protein
MTHVQQFGQNAGAHLLVSMTLHAFNRVLAFFFLRMATAMARRRAATEQTEW